MDEVMDSAGLQAQVETLIDSSGAPILKLIGELDISSAAPISTEMDTIVAKRPELVILDVSELRFIDSSGLSLFVGLADLVSEVELRNPSPMIRKVIDLTGLSSVFILTP